MFFQVIQIVSSESSRFRKTLVHLSYFCDRGRLRCRYGLYQSLNGVIPNLIIHPSLASFRQDQVIMEPAMLTLEQSSVYYPTNVSATICRRCPSDSHIMFSTAWIDNDHCLKNHPTRSVVYATASLHVWLRLISFENWLSLTESYSPRRSAFSL